MKFITAFWVWVVLMCIPGFALAACPLNSIDPGEASSAANPVQLVVPCACIAWAAPVGFPIHHYHLFSDEIMRVSQEPTQYEFCMTEKRVVYEVVVKSVSTELMTTDTTVSGSLFIEWVDRQCLDGDRVVSC